MKQIALGGKHGVGKFALVDDEDFIRLNKYRWRCNIDGYATRSAVAPFGRQRTVRMHREIMNYHGEADTDHRDSNRLNNQRYNLRKCTTSENMKNRGVTKANTSGFKGVSKSGKKWRGYIKSDQKIIGLGTFGSKIEAAKAYNEAAIKYHGEFAKLNVIP